jgi:hypothetical protein
MLRAVSKVLAKHSQPVQQSESSENTVAADVKTQQTTDTQQPAANASATEPLPERTIRFALPRAEKQDSDGEEERPEPPRARRHRTLPTPKRFLFSPEHIERSLGIKWRPNRRAESPGRATDASRTEREVSENARNTQQAHRTSQMPLKICKEQQVKNIDPDLKAAMKLSDALLAEAEKNKRVQEEAREKRAQVAANANAELARIKQANEEKARNAQQAHHTSQMPLKICKEQQVKNIDPDLKAAMELSDALLAEAEKNKREQEAKKQAQIAQWKKTLKENKEHEEQVARTLKQAEECEKENQRKLAEAAKKAKAAAEEVAKIQEIRKETQSSDTSPAESDVEDETVRFIPNANAQPSKNKLKAESSSVVQKLLSESKSASDDYSNGSKNKAKAPAKKQPANKPPAKVANRRITANSNSNSVARSPSSKFALNNVTTHNTFADLSDSDDDNNFTISW